MEPGFHWKAFGHDGHLAEPRQEAPEFSDAELEQHRRIVVFEPDLRELRQRVQPRDPVVHLEDGLPARLQHPATLFHQAPGIARVLHHAVRVHQIERVVGKRQALSVGDLEVARETLLRKIGLRELDGRRREIDSGDAGAALRETRQIDAGAAPDLENRLTPVSVKIDQAQQVVQLLEMIVIEIVEKPA